MLLCIVITGIIGPRIISSGIMYRDGFGIYGGAGKALAFAAIAFGLIARDKLSSVKLRAWSNKQLLWLALCAASVITAWVVVSQLIAGSNSLSTVIGAHVSMLTSVTFAALAVFGPENIWTLIKQFKKELIISVVVSVVFFMFLELVYGLWKYLSFIVMHGVAWLLRTSGLEVMIVPELTLLLDKFGVTIEKYCSGIESIALFSGLYAVVGALDWPRLNKKRYFLAFPVALVILFGLNILRVYLLILAGYYINQQIAFSLFHTYAGMLFFMLYAGAFWFVMYKHLVGKPIVPPKD